MARENLYSLKMREGDGGIVEEVGGWSRCLRVVERSAIVRRRPSALKEVWTGRELVQAGDTT